MMSRRSDGAGNQSPSKGAIVNLIKINSKAVSNESISDNSSLKLQKTLNEAPSGLGKFKVPADNRSLGNRESNEGNKSSETLNSGRNMSPYVDVLRPRGIDLYNNSSDQNQEELQLPQFPQHNR